MGTLKNFQELVNNALHYAIKVHGQQQDRAGLPYILHPLAVANTVRDDQEAFIVALLHDCLEDGDAVTAACIHNWLSSKSLTAYHALLAITKGRSEDTEYYWRRCRKNPLALKVKLADIAHNTSPERLNHLPEETRARLIKKYTRAKEVLLENHGN